MPILKCKICGGDMEVSPDKLFGTCEYCGTTMTLPKIDDEQRAAAFNRGNHFRRAGEFDKALQVYEHIITEDPNDAEAHWCCALCRYGIEWVEDPATMEYLPTCHRASFDIFTDDVDCKAAIDLSEGITKRQYQRDASKIADVQKGILATSQKEDPFDVFICYKESDENGNRTVDSTLAQDIYYQLTDQGLRVFFARITLEDKVGSQYEPYIFAALNSAKVMLVVGTKSEYFNAVWVKNEWSRFMSIVKRDRSRVLLPCYRDMDPYDLPEQLSVLQPYDMSKIGFIQDLIRGIKKITKTDEPKMTVVKETIVAGGNANVAPLLKRAFMFLEDGNWQEADEYCEKVLDIDPENAQAYVGKLMAEFHAKKQDDLKNCDKLFSGSNNYQKAVRFSDEKTVSDLKSYISYIKERNEKARINGIYNDAVSIMNSACTEAECKSAAEKFKAIAGYKDADKLTDVCRKKIEEIKAKEEERRIADVKLKKKARKTLLIVLPIVFALAISFVVLIFTIGPAILIRTGNYKAVINMGITEIKIPEGVTKIEDHAFSGYTSLTSITIPNSVKSIGKKAFYGCTSLTSVTIGNGVTSIGDYAFDGCRSLTSVYIIDIAKWCGISFGDNPLLYAQNLYLSGELVTDLAIPEGVTSIGDYAFECCRSLTSIEIPNSVMLIGREAFSGCNSLTSVTIPNSVTSIGINAFNNCSSLTSITFEKDSKLKIIDSCAFRYCGELTRIEVPNSVTSIGDYAFSGCYSLTSVTIGNSVTSIGERAFSSCSSLTSITIPNSVTSIGDYAFDGCTSLTSVTIGNGVTSIGDYAFSGCYSLTSVIIGNSVTSIGERAFSSCSSLTSITIPNSVTSIGRYAFSACRKLITVTFANKIGWHTSNGTMSVDDSSTNAENLKSYNGWDWYRK